MRLLLLLFCSALVGSTRTHRSVHKRSPRCGRWQHDYSALHQQIVAGASPPRYLFHLCDEGLADCSVGAVSALYLAVMTNRAFFTGKFTYHFFFNESHSGHLDAALSRPAGGIDWRVPSDLIDEHFPNSEHIMLLGLNQPRVTNSKLRAMYAQASSVTDSVVMFSNAGITHRMFDVAEVRTKMSDLGVTRANAFGCGLDYLFEPHPIEAPLFRDEMRIFGEPRELPVIAVQVRTGDVAFRSTLASRDAPPGADHAAAPERGAEHDGKSAANQFAGVVSCVQDIKRHLHAPRAAVYIISDSVAVRRSLARLFAGDTVVANTDLSVQHSGPHQRSAPITQEGLRAAATEFWLFGEADYHVAFRWSGYGRAAAARVAAHKPMHLYLLDDYSTLASCSPDREVGVAAVGAMRPGI